MCGWWGCVDGVGRGLGLTWWCFFFFFNSVVKLLIFVKMEVEGRWESRVEEREK